MTRFDIPFLRNKNCLLTLAREFSQIFIRTAAPEVAGSIPEVSGSLRWEHKLLLTTGTEGHGNNYLEISPEVTWMFTEVARKLTYEMCPWVPGSQSSSTITSN